MTQGGPPPGEDNEDEAAVSAALSNEQKLKSKVSTSNNKNNESRRVKKKDSDDDNGESESTSSSKGQTSGEGYNADCSSDTSSDLSGSAKNKEKDNMIVSVCNLSIDEDSEAPSNNCNMTEGRNENVVAPPASSEQVVKDNTSNNIMDRKKKAKKMKRKGRAEPANHPENDDGESDTSGAGPMRRVAQWNGMQVFHPMDPRIDISRVGYLHISPVGQHLAGDAQPKQDEPPSLEHYEQLMEIVRPFFTANGIGENPSEPVQDEGLPRGDPLDAMASAMHITQEDPSSRQRPGYHGSGGDSRTSTSLSGARSSSSQSSRSGERRQKDAPLHLLSNQQLAATAQVPLQLAARQRPLQAAAAADFYAPDDDPADRDDDDSDTSSMVVLARTKRKHKQQPNDASSQDETRTDAALDDQSGRQHHERPDAMDEDDQEDLKPAARPQAPLQQHDVRNRNQELQPRADDDDEAAQGGSASSSSSSSGQRIPPGALANQARPNYDVAHVITESSANNNTTTSGSASGSGSGSGANSGSNQGSSGSGNGSSGSGNEGKGSSEDVGTKEEAGGASNSNSEDVNSDDRKAPEEMEIAHPVAARRHGAGAVAEGGANDTIMLDAPSPQAATDQNVAARERKLQDKKRKRMNMRREYEEKVQQEIESSQSSATKGAILLRPGRPVTLDKVLSFTKIARMVIQAGPPFLVVHTNAAYTRLTGIDAHAAVGKPVSALLAVQGPDSAGGATEGIAREPNSAALDHGRQNQIEVNHVVSFMTWNPSEFHRQGESHVEAEEAGRARAAQRCQNESGNVNLERLVAVCGFGKYHVLHARARAHQMVGRNVTFVNRFGQANGALPPAGVSSSLAANGMRRLDDGSSDPSLEGSFDSLKCRSSISPIISDSIDSAVVTDNNQDSCGQHCGQKSKRRKHHHIHGGTDQQGSTATARSGAHHHHHQRRTHLTKDSMIPKRFQQYVTHYAIQLEHFDDSKELNDNGSMSSNSTSIEANLLGLTKEELRRQRQAAQAGERGTSQEDSEQRRQQDEDDEMASETTEETAPVTAVG